MTEQNGVFDRIRARGNEVFQQVTNELMSNEHFVKAVQGAVRGKEKFDKAVGRALRTLNVPTRAEFQKVLARLEALEGEMASRRPIRKPATRKRRRAAK
ncbi:MAG TPA: hypothetical protein VN083_03215 [Vicinamibacteria bacterium]|nr:hypothetical protein [Vicinamibacteria bacterium]